MLSRRRGITPRPTLVLAHRTSGCRYDCICQAVRLGFQGFCRNISAEAAISQTQTAAGHELEKFYTRSEKQLLLDVIYEELKT